MLLTDLYQILSAESAGAGAWNVQVELNPRHAIYQGHFPGSPVLPGVCSLLIIKECLEGALKSALQYTRISSCKFTSAINPEVSPALRLALAVKETEEGWIRLSAEGFTGEAGFIKLKAFLQKK